MYEETDFRYRIENLSSGETVEFDLPNPLRPVQLLPVPYVSQLEPGAEDHHNDCGPATAVMLLAAYSVLKLTPDEFYSTFGIGGDKYLSATQLRVILERQGLVTDWVTNLGLSDIFSFLYQRKPFIPLIKYAALSSAGLTESHFTGPHFLVVIGVDPVNVYVHDPLYQGHGGEAKAYPLDHFLEAWVAAGQDGTGNPERAALVPRLSLGQSLVRQVKINTARLNVRAGPGMNYPAVGTLKRGELVTLGLVLGRWAEIGPRRWVMLEYTVAA